MINLKKLLLQSESGQAMVMATFVSAAVAAGAYFMLGGDQGTRGLKLDNARNAASIIKENLMATLDNDAAWAQTVLKNPSLQCLRTPGATCTPDKFGPIDIYDADGTLVLSSAANQGHDYGGKQCAQFKPTPTDLLCVFKFVVTWACHGACGTTTFGTGLPVAITPRIRLSATFQFSSKDQDLKILPKANGFGFNFIRGSKGKTLSQYCNSIDGVFDQKAGACSSSISKPKSFDCTDINPHSWFMGFQKDGTPICKPDAKLGQFCRSGSAVLGYQEDGRVICGAF